MLLSPSTSSSTTPKRPASTDRSPDNRLDNRLDNPHDDIDPPIGGAGRRDPAVKVFTRSMSVQTDPVVITTIAEQLRADRKRTRPSPLHGPAGTAGSNVGTPPSRPQAPQSSQPPRFHPSPFQPSPFHPSPFQPWPFQQSPFQRSPYQPSPFQPTRSVVMPATTSVPPGFNPIRDAFCRAELARSQLGQSYWTPNISSTPMPAATQAGNPLSRLLDSAPMLGRPEGRRDSFACRHHPGCWFGPDMMVDRLRSPVVEVLPVTSDDKTPSAPPATPSINEPA